jgi:sugar/nucleoside kinase (ribokinase family)
MKKYHLYGLGNALVDLEYEVTPEFLKEHHIEKGVMTLVDEPRQKYLMNVYPSKSVKKQGGGSAANTIIAASLLGAKTFYSCKVANDEFGHFYSDDLRECGVATSLKKEKLENGITGTCLVMVTSDADRTMNTFLGITSTLSEKDVDEAALLDSEILYIEGYLVCAPGAFKAAMKAKEIARKNNIKIALTFSDPFVVKAFLPQFQELLSGGIDYLFCNEDEVEAYTGLKLSEAALKKLQPVAKTIVATQGARGILGMHDNRVVEVATTPVKPLDTNGAGDMIAGAFLFGMSQGYSYEKSAKLANKCAGKVVCQFGPRLKKDELQKNLRELV